MHTCANSPEEFREQFLCQMEFLPETFKHYTLYHCRQRPEQGYVRLYQNPGKYDFGIGDYTIHKDFSICFSTSLKLLRIGLVYDGTTSFHIPSFAASSFEPSSFLTLEANVKGIQRWKIGQHFHGAELTLYPAFFEELAGRFQNFDLEKYFLLNHTYRHLPAGILPAIHRLIRFDASDSLNPFHLESAILDCLGSIAQCQTADGNNAFSVQIDYGGVAIGNDRYIRFSSDDFRIIQKIHDYLSKCYKEPPTIDALSRDFLISPQKLKAGFPYYFHMTIGEYISSLRMSTAATLLCTTEKSVQEIAKEVGYTYASNFARRFQNTYHCTPLKYRMREKKRSGKET